MIDDIKSREATLLVLLDLEDALAQEDLKAVQEGREKRLILAIDLFIGDRKRHDTLQQLFDVSGRWVRGVGSAETVREALKRAIPLFEH